MSQKKAKELLKDLQKRREKVPIDEIEYSLFPTDADYIIGQAIAELKKQPEPCKTCGGSGEVDDVIHSVNAGIDISKPCTDCQPNLKAENKMLKGYIKVRGKTHLLCCASQVGGGMKECDCGFE